MEDHRSKHEVQIYIGADKVIRINVDGVCATRIRLEGTKVVFEDERAKPEPDVIIPDFNFFIEDRQVRGIEGYAIRCEPSKTVGYFAAAYVSRDQAERVLHNIIKDFNMQHYRANFTNASSPLYVRDIDGKDK